MVRDRANRRMKTFGAVLAGAVMLIWSAGEAIQAQTMMRSPSINIAPRITRINPNITGRVITNVERFPRGPGCGDADRAGCSNQLSSFSDGGSSHKVLAQTRHDSPRRGAQGALNLRFVPNEIVAEIDGSLSPAQADGLARRHGLARLQSQTVPLIGATIGLFRITDRRSVGRASRDFATETGVRSVQPNYRYALQDQKVTLTEGDPAQYALAKLRLPEAHTLAHGAHVTIAVIDSGIDVKHPEFADSIAASWDALGSKEGPHVHGTGVAGAIVAHVRLMGSAPAARILAIRAFAAGQNGAESTSFVILRSLDYAASHGAQIINMSFAGPKDALIERGVAAIAARGIVMVAAAGNAGAKSAPLYPAANPDVIAVSGTDAQDRLFSASNRGSYIAVAAPGVDIFLPAPDDKYQMTSGTSFSAALVSGIAALLLERNPALKPEDLRTMLTKTARDLGAPGRDDLFGAGEADAYAAVSATVAASRPVAASDRPATEPPTEKPLDQKEVEQRDGPTERALASDKAAAGEADRPDAR
ncbi:MAG: S8 family serine peptidase [Bradyrhizobium sp.]|uniref:S8 family serine peptidase n=1 Tax=Bradyrhizobium sp. TaxID=376 RepID=UPI001C29C944|nr:S8 family serine peptidase [Bradyrhizobium sp.]MBU6462353.1 S8 family serine peptidase [Pseudomonadota bacterium]MDE2067407.1 S8 family serine peptidase [Bradyrhizobium sp.]MDE2242623.1 S8 family serine peptidase [Bradyrhizobium sp.]MDE2467362.1 S8 family serine peptidase [Bradyrhizobium sp.]